MVTNQILQLPRNIKRLIVLSVDLIILPFALWVSFSLRLGEFYIPRGEVIYLFLVLPVIAVPIFVRVGLYRAVIRYIGYLAMWAVVKGVTLYTLIWGVVVLLSGIPGVPRSVLIINWLMVILLIGGSRAIARWWLADSVAPSLQNIPQKRVAIYGAGRAGIQIAAALSNSPSLRPVAFIDDNPALQGNFIGGLRVYSFRQINSIIEDLSVSEVVLAMPSTPRSAKSNIISMLEPYSVHVTTLPGLEDLASGKIKADDIREVGVRDLLGRDPVEPDKSLLNMNIKDKVVMVTGAGGSIGSELCRQIIKIKPAALILYERSEHDLYAVEKELVSLDKRIHPDNETDIIPITPILASISNRNRFVTVCKAFGVQTIYHAAAYKHVPMVEKNPSEAIQNNVLGTYTAATAAIDTGVEAFVLISTDKAVRPTSTMGASKRFAEMILQALSKRKDIGTRFCMVRFGNVLDSSGSVVPLFRDQIKNGGPVTVTDAKVTRYFMTTQEAAQLVIQAGAMGQGGDVFVLDMGQPVKILDLAKRMIHLSGLEIKDSQNVHGDIEVVFTGLRPGEKLYEELLIGENVLPTKHPLIMSANEEDMDMDKIMDYISRFENAVENNDASASRMLLIESVKGFTPQCDVADLVLERAKNLNVQDSPDIAPKYRH